MKINILSILVILFASQVLASSITYDITINGLVDQNAFSQTISEIKECEDKCTYPLPTFNLPENFTFSDYSLSNQNILVDTIYFESTSDLITSNIADNIVVEVVELKEELKITRLITHNLNLGQNNLVFEVENTGGKDLSEVYITISGNGVKTINSPAIDISKGKSDFITSTVLIESSGEIDIIIKAYSDDILLGKVIESISVNKPIDEVLDDEPAPVFVDEDYAINQISLLWDSLNNYESDFFTKESNEYSLPDLSDTIDETKEEIKQLELSFSTLTKDQFDKNVLVINRSLNHIKEQLDLARPKKLSERIRENLILIGTGLGILVSSLTAYGLAKSHISHKNRDIKQQMKLIKQRKNDKKR